MVANLLYYMRETARWFTALGTSNIMCMAHALIRGPTPANLMAGPTGPQLKERGLRSRTRPGRYIWISPDLLERLKEALAMMGPRTSYCRETNKDYQVSKC